MSRLSGADARCLSEVGDQRAWLYALCHLGSLIEEKKRQIVVVERSSRISEGRRDIGLKHEHEKLSPDER